MNYSIGIDIGGTNTVVGLVDADGLVVKKEKLKTKDFVSADDYLKSVTAKIELLADSVKEEHIILGVGIGAPNGNFYHGTIEYAPNLPFNGIIELKDILETLLLRDGYNLKVTVTNDANAAAIGEMIYGKAKNVKNFVMITLGTGVGSGIVVDGKLVYGHTGFAGEVGHTIIDIDGRQCNCGRKGCVERYASATGIVITIKQMLNESTEQSLLRAINEDEITSKDIYEAALKGDSLALKCFDYTAKMLALGIANACEITSPEKVYLFGGLSKSGDILLNPLKKYLNEFLFSVFQNTIEVELSGLKEEDAAILGAAALCY
ncbi:MAG: ROK family protein [Bacteroidales bacterium]|nr:ROK family protein [Bacteroidales bacterium]